MFGVYLTPHLSLTIMASHLWTAARGRHPDWQHQRPAVGAGAKKKTNQQKWGLNLSKLDQIRQDWL